MNNFTLVYHKSSMSCISDSPPTIFVPTHDGIRAYSPSGYGGHSVFSTDSKIKSVDFFVSQNTTAVLWLDSKKHTINLAAFEGSKKPVDY